MSRAAKPMTPAAPLATVARGWAAAEEEDDLEPEPLEPEPPEPDPPEPEAPEVEDGVVPLVNDGGAVE